jgi:hypothetical protein
MKGNKNYECGVNIGEQKVKRSLQRKGAKTKVSPGSRGAFDIVAKKDTGKKWGIQVKATCMENGKAKMPSKTEIKRMQKKAKKQGVTPVIALVHPNKHTEYIYANSGKKAKF